ncbi:MAG: ABC transporter ATP-binding protein [Deinococcota bacterium]
MSYSANYSSPKASVSELLVDVQQVSLQYGQGESSTLALEQVSLTVHKGEFVAVVGRSGCGKSSLVKLISGLLSPTSGQVLVDGTRISKPLGNAGMAFQNSSLLPWRTVLKNVLLPLEVVRSKRNAYRRNPRPFVKHAEELLATVGLAGFEHRYPWQLSGGMRQRVSLCRALVHAPELLLLDEPFGALDAFTKEELWQVLQQLRDSTGCSIVLITHDLAEAVFLADRVYAMTARPGQIAAITDVALPGDRHDLDIRFTPAFSELVAKIRHDISGAAVQVAA